MVIELEMLQSKLAGIPGFPADLKTLVEHLIISHHGEYEFGSPKLPMFPEALVLHYLDDLDSKVESMRAHFEREAASDGAWTSYNPSLGRPLLNSTKFLMPKEKTERTENAESVQDANSAPADGQPPQPQLQFSRNHDEENHGEKSAASPVTVTLHPEKL
jgi:3'-5' exoribonuclease